MPRTPILRAVVLSAGFVFAACAGPASAPADLGGASDAASPLDALSPDAASDTQGSDGLAADAPGDTGPLLTPIHAVRVHPGRVPDAPYRADRVVTTRPTEVFPAGDVRALAATEGAVWAATTDALFVLPTDEADFRAVALPGLDGAIASLAPADGDSVLVASGSAVAVVPLEGAPVVHVAPGIVTHAFPCAGAVGAIVDGAFLVGAAYDGPAAWGDAGGLDGVLAGACDGAEWLALRADGLWRRAGEGAAWVPAWTAPEDEPAVTLASVGGLVVVATARRVAVVAGPDAGAHFEAALGGLPTAGVRALAVAPGGARFAVGHDVGVSLRTPEGPRPFAHRHSARWLPADAAIALAWAPSGTLWVATPGGLAALTGEETTLDVKAERMLAALAVHDRLGFVPPSAFYDDPLDPAAAPRFQDDDNDGQWSEEALAALCYAFATTGDERYRTRARRVLDAMLLLFDVPAVSFVAAGREPGFVARSVVRDDEGALFDGKATQPNWHLATSAGRDWYWKDDTSSDETTGHWFGLSLYYDLCARDDAERAEVAARLASLMDSLLAHGLRLVDLDGAPTEHGYWDPDTLAIALDGLMECAAVHPFEACADAWGGSGFLNSVEILGGLLATWHVTGDARYLEAYETLVVAERYGELATFAPNTLTWTDPAFANYCDHELADLAFLTLLRYEPDPARRALWLASQRAAWEYERGERNPLKALAFVAATDEDAAWLADGVRTLREYPEDLRDWRVDNSHRTDVVRGGADRFGTSQFTEVLPYDEIHGMRWDGNPYRVADGGDGRERRAATFWLLPYWGLRYHGALGGP